MGSPVPTTDAYQQQQQKVTCAITVSIPGVPESTCPSSVQKCRICRPSPACVPEPCPRTRYHAAALATLVLRAIHRNIRHQLHARLHEMTTHMCRRSAMWTPPVLETRAGHRAVDIVHIPAPFVYLLLHLPERLFKPRLAARAHVVHCGFAEHVLDLQLTGLHAHKDSHVEVDAE